MGIAELNNEEGTLTVSARLFFYGDAVWPSLCNTIADDIERYWNETKATVSIKGRTYRVHFNMEGIYKPALTPDEIFENTDPRNNYFRIEEYSATDISFVDGIGCNTGYFKLENLLHNSTTAAHEFGHTIGLDHPADLDIRGTGTPGIMYPRGTLVDPSFQYNPEVAAGTVGGTLNPFLRKVLQTDFDDLKLNKLRFDEQGRAVLGDFSSLWHPKHNHL